IQNNRATGIWVNLDKSLITNGELNEDLSDKYIEVIGTFSNHSRGHLNQYLGELDVICIPKIE
ncbi:MAG: hypothetical protein WBA74_18880, partial [Cyclobacteriaceae bacterium]